MSLIIEDLRVVYNSGRHRVLAVDNFDLSLSSGEMGVIIGESGSGKTTIAKSILGLLKDEAHTHGKIEINGESILDKNEKELNTIRWDKVSMVFQNSRENLDPTMNIFDACYEPVKRKGFTKEEFMEKLVSLFSELNLDSAILKKYPSEISGGELQRVQLAMALVCEPDVLILDEPTSSVDMFSKNLVFNIIKHRAKEGMTILLITHDIDFASKLDGSCSIIYLGQTMEITETSNLSRSCKHPYTEGLRRSAPVLGGYRDLQGMKGDAHYRYIHRHEQSDSEHIHTHESGKIHKKGHAPVKGCLYYGRCVQASSECVEYDGEMVSSDGSLVRCVKGGIVSALNVKNLMKKYGYSIILKNLEINLRSGETLAVTGRSGSGKTTLAKCISGVVDFEDGEIDIFGQNIKNMGRKELSKHIGFVYQDPYSSVNPSWNVEKIVSEPLVAAKENKEEIKEKVMDILKSVRLPSGDDFLLKTPAQLNGGALQRVCMARALINEPKLLIMDEPTSSLDVSVQAKLMRLLTDIQSEKGLSIIFITHDIALASKTADNIAVMKDGIISEYGSAENVIRKILNKN